MQSIMDKNSQKKKVGQIGNPEMRRFCLTLILLQIRVVIEFIIGKVQETIQQMVTSLDSCKT